MGFAAAEEETRIDDELRTVLEAGFELDEAGRLDVDVGLGEEEAIPTEDEAGLIEDDAGCTAEEDPELVHLPKIELQPVPQ